MITSVLESLTGRIEIFDAETGNLRHPLFATRPEKRVLLIVVSGDKGFAGAFNSNILKTAFQFIEANPDKEIDVEAVGRKGRDLMRRRYPAAEYMEETDEHGQTRQVRASARGAVEVSGDHPGMLLKLETSRVFELAESIIARYVHEEIDAAYIVYNEFKSVIQQRLVVEKLLPLIEIGSRRLPGPWSQPRKRRERAGEAAISAGIALEPADTQEADEEARQVRHGAGGLHLRAAGRGTVQRAAAAIRFFHALSRHDGIGGRGTCGAHDGDGFGIEQRLGHDRRATRCT